MTTRHEVWSRHTDGRVYAIKLFLESTEMSILMKMTKEEIEDFQRTLREAINEFK